MATKTVTIDTGEWIYPDASGSPHTVTNAETFTFELTDGGAAAVTYQSDHNKSLACTDGSRIFIRSNTSQSVQGVAAANGTRGTWGPTADAQDATAVVGLRGSLVTSHSNTGVEQYWRAATMTVDNVDAPTAISGRFEDQFGNTFTWTTVTVS